MSEVRRQVEKYLAALEALAPPPLKLMEVCGTHTTAIARMGLKSLLPPQVELLSGPGCPVCVTSQRELDALLGFALATPDAVVTTYGDMLKVPGQLGNLVQATAKGARVKPVYSALDALALAEKTNRLVVFFAVGFETTAPGTALALREAQRKQVKNFRVFCMHKLIPPALELLLQDQSLDLDGLLLPGHVSVIIGLEPYRFLAERFGRPGVVAGFEPLEITRAVYRLVQLCTAGTPEIVNEYPAVVRPEGNVEAQRLLEETFEPCDSEWRGLGLLPQSGYRLKAEFAAYDASELLAPFMPAESQEPPGCRCGDVLRGVIKPEQCPLFAKSCTPEAPVGPCMVSAEGACAASFTYRNWGQTQ